MPDTRSLDVLTRETALGSPLDQDRLRNALTRSTAGNHFIHPDISRRNHATGQLTFAVGVNHAEFEEGRLLDLRLGLQLVGLAQARKLYQDAATAGRGDHRLGHTKAIHTTAEHLDGLFGDEVGIHHDACIGLSAAHVHLEEELRATLQIQTESEFASSRPLNSVEDPSGHIAFDRSINVIAREERPDVVGANRYQQVRVGDPRCSVHVGRVQLLGLLDDLIERLVGGRGLLLEGLDEVFRGRWVDLAH